MQYFFLFFTAFLLSTALVPLVKRFAFGVGAIDIPNSPRKIHKDTIPLLGGLAAYVSFVVVTVGYIIVANPNLTIIPLKFYIATFLGGFVLMVGGYLDDKYNLPPRYQIIFPILASFIAVQAGIGVGIKSITNPIGQLPIDLSFDVLGIPFSGIFMFVFILGMTYTTKILDGLDGLAGGISFIAGLTLFFLSLANINNQPITASLAIIFCGAVLGFLLFNFNPASVFLGEGGSEWLGFMLAILAVILGGKIATAVLVMGIPILDVAWAIIRRLWNRQPLAGADRLHLHFRLLDIGFSQRQTALVLYSLAALFGFGALFLQSLGKFISLIILVLVMASLALLTVVVYRRRAGDEAK
jgi:UDP-GlcNAc:undecaprenyl-phosphate/decaprenyl-phosphate GlcNAc-1-phosphate transferase